jgi:para-aminobenzoate synthetase
LTPDCSDSLAEAREQILVATRKLKAGHAGPVVVALDGPSGAGKSTLARVVAQAIDAVVVPLDDFFSAGITDAGWGARSVEEMARDSFEWERVRGEAIEPLLAGKRAQWRAFDFEGGQRPDGTYGMCSEYRELDPAPVILLDGAYSSGPQLADLVDLMVLVDVPADQRQARLAAREEADFLDVWHARWDAVEEFYFTRVRPRESFDIVVTLSGPLDPSVLDMAD